MSRLDQLQNQLREVQNELARFQSYQKPKTSQLHFTNEINALLRRKRNIQVNINQEKQKPCPKSQQDSQSS